MAAISLQKTHGILGLVGPAIDELALQVLHSAPPGFPKSRLAPYHVTLLTKEELKRFPSDQLTNVDSKNVMPLGLGGNSSVFFVVIVWAAGQLFRKQLGLAPKQFHITLSARDDHGLDKSVASLLPGQIPPSPTLDHLAFTLHLSGLFQQAQPYCIDCIHAFPDSHRGFLRLADASLSLHEHKLAMLSYGRAFERVGDVRIEEYCLKKLLECAKHTEWGSVMRKDELTQIPAAIADVLLAPWSPALRSRLSDAEFVPTLQLESRLPLYIPGTYKLPRWFRWLVPFHLCIMSTPRHEDDIAALASPHLGIRHILTLTEEESLPKKWFHGKPITNTFLPVANYAPPSIEQMDIIMRLVEDETKLPLLVHCGGGKGRAGTVVACYLAAYGFHKPAPYQDHPEMAAPDAIASLRLIRPGSLETSRQEAFVSKWCSIIWKRQSVYPDLPSEPPPCALETKGTPNLKDSDLFVLVGLPGAGKSWFSQALRARDPTGWSRISQDDSGSRAACESEIGHAKGRVLLDRCNTDPADRKIWLDLASNWASAPVCIWFDYDKVLCESRAQMRAGHPTLPPGSRVRNAVEQMHKAFVAPTLKEGFKAIVHVKSFAAAEELVQRLSPPISLYKFPRTPHLINLGAATADDVLTDTSALAGTGHVVITEKVDGANMGFWLSPERELRIQNRSHYVTPASHEQFKKLGLWADVHLVELLRVLGRDAHFPSRYVLYGEWLAVTHSIPYARLPDRFMAFDLYDRSTDSWADRQTLAALLADTTIQMVPVLYEGVLPSEAELRGMVQLPSKFWDGRIEGIYVKVERDGQVVSRGKVVRADFIAGNEHWTKGNLRTNELARVE